MREPNYTDNSKPNGFFMFFGIAVTILLCLAIGVFVDSYFALGGVGILLSVIVGALLGLGSGWWINQRVRRTLHS
jgi:hypothetical protein